jgi:hypothetical protein
MRGGTVSISAAALRASTPTAAREYCASLLRSVWEMKGFSRAAGMLSTQ